MTAAADPSAQNVTAYGSTAAWSRRAAERYHPDVARGTHRRRPVPVSSARRPRPRPDEGQRPHDRLRPRRRPVPLRRRCRRRVQADRAVELATQTAPSFFKDTLVFSRTTGRRPGTYLLRPGKRLVRIFPTVAVETDVAATRIIGRYGSGAKSIVRILNMNADSVRIVARAKAGQRVTSPSLTRFNRIWLRVKAGSAAAEQVGVNSHRGLDVLTADRELPGGTSSIASTNIPTLYSGSQGVQRIAPKLRMR